MTVNVAEVLPAATRTLAGRVAALLLLVSLTVSPPLVAGPVNVTVPVEGFPPGTAVGSRLTENSAGGVMVNVAPVERPLNAAMISAVCRTVTTLVVTVNVTLVCSGGTVTVLRTCATEFVLDKATVAPVFAAGPFNVTVPMAEVPPATTPGLTLNMRSDNGTIVRLAFLEVVPRVAVIVAVTVFGGDDVETTKLADVVPAATVTVAGTLA